MLVRFTAPAPGLAVIGTHQTGATTNAGISAYFYGADADTTASSVESRLAEWLPTMMTNA